MQESGRLFLHWDILLSVIKLGIYKSILAVICVPIDTGLGVEEFMLLPCSSCECCCGFRCKIWKAFFFFLASGYFSVSNKIGHL